MICKKCGKENGNDDKFCFHCGALLESSAEAAPLPSSEKKTGKKMILVLTGVALAVVILALGGFAFVRMLSGSSSALLVYDKDNELNLLSGKKTYSLDADFLEDASEAGAGNWWYMDYDQYFCKTEDGKYLFYPENYDYNGEFRLYRKQLNRPNEDAVKVDSDVLSYSVLDGNQIVYLKGPYSDNRLYYSDMKDKNKIASDVEWYMLSGDKKSVLWLTLEDKLYMQDVQGEHDKIKLDSNVDSVFGRSEDLSTIVYTTNDGTLYVIRDGEDKEKIHSDVSRVWTFDMDDKMNIYFTVNGDEESDLSGLISDRHVDADAKMTEPDIRNYQSKVMKDSFWGPQESTVIDDQYYVDLQTYEDKCARDELRSNLNQIVSLPSVELYRYTDGDSELVVEGAISDVFPSNGLLAIGYLNFEKTDKIDLNDLMQMSYDEIQDEITARMEEAIVYQLLEGDTKWELEADAEECGSSISWFTVDRDSHDAYIVFYNGNGYSGTITKTDYSKKDGKIEIIEEDAVAFAGLHNGKCYYYTGDSADDVWTLNVDGEEIMDDVERYSAKFTEDGKAFFRVDPDKDGNAAELFMYDGKDAVQIAEDVSYAAYLKNGSVAVLVDYSARKQRGDLMIYKRGKLEQIDSDVSFLRYCE